ncbi:MAG TPA: hypothetical protein VGI26_00590 [Solirubrobacteraceae bacterium]
MRLVVVASALTVGVFAVGVAGATKAPHQHRHHGAYLHHVSARAASTSAIQSASFTALDQAPATSVPTGLLDAAESPGMASEYGPNIALARAVPAPGGGSQWYLVPGANSLCLWANGSLDCATTTQAEEGKLNILMPQTPPPYGQDTRQKIVGVTPDGVQSVLSSSDGADSGVSENVYSITETGPTSLRFVGTGENTTLPAAIDIP